jgi:hypothetical protein
LKLMFHVTLVFHEGIVWKQKDISFLVKHWLRRHGRMRLPQDLYLDLNFLRQKRRIGEILTQLTISNRIWFSPIYYKLTQITKDNQIWFPPSFSLSDLLHHSWLISIKRMIKNIIVVLLLILVVLRFETCWHFGNFWWIPDSKNPRYMRDYSLKN